MKQICKLYFLEICFVWFQTYYHKILFTEMPFDLFSVWCSQFHPKTVHSYHLPLSDSTCQGSAYLIHFSNYQFWVSVKCHCVFYFTELCSSIFFLVYFIYSDTFITSWIGHLAIKLNKNILSCNLQVLMHHFNCHYYVFFCQIIIAMNC